MKKCHFCFLEISEKKTFSYTKMYVDFLNSNLEMKKYCQIGNRIQALEIIEHLKNKGIDEKSVEGMIEANQWIIENGEKFRHYLNTIKYLADVFHISEKTFNFENFSRALERLNKTKEYNESIF